MCAFVRGEFDELEFPARSGKLEIASVRLSAINFSFDSDYSRPYLARINLLRDVVVAVALRADVLLLFLSLARARSLAHVLAFTW